MTDKSEIELAAEKWAQDIDADAWAIMGFRAGALWAINELVNRITEKHEDDQNGSL